MPNVKSAIKRVKKSEAQRARNRRDRSRLRTALKRVLGAAEASEEERTAELRAATSLLDRAARKGLIHPNKAARDKSRLSRRTRSTPAGGTA